jgi:uncharacterized protein
MNAATGSRDEHASLEPAMNAVLGSGRPRASRASATKANAVAFASGLVFAFGLGLSGMTRPGKILGFLDVAGAWDPSLALVMVGAVGVHFLFVRRARRRASPWLAPRFAWPPERRIDARLLAGAALFGIGWGLAGYCPGPALVALASFGPGVLLFVSAMAVGMFAVGKLDRE